ncbi:MAG: hypothetical protein H6721_23595 [Sandaracinus sp.]|nr:hypothetical protein [Myxococcales bacterium]MCB9616535.1 hypothetical protein [Sandaracinus sp.]MCB9635121.1 hypothetical protein [Sandaracinus sp.]
MRFSSPLVAFLLLLTTSACGDDDGGEADAAVDATVDAARSDAGFDAGPPCLLECESGLTCCLGADGEPACVDTESDLANCGRCGSTCGPDRGTACVEGLCECGRVAIGCEGSRGSICCPVREDRPEPYCANLLTDGANCGGCGDTCDALRSDSCQAGECVCGDSRAPCGDDEHCCADFGGASSSCVDVTTNRENCGACGRRCRAGEDCASGVCRSRTDAGADAGTDAGADAGIDGGIDAGGV